eukprot:1510139-Prymnesium_polylepis.2
MATCCPKLDQGLVQVLNALLGSGGYCVVRETQNRQRKLLLVQRPVGLQLLWHRGLTGLVWAVSCKNIPCVAL